VLHMLGFYGVDYISLNAFVSGNMILNNMNGATIFLYLIPFVIGGISLKKILKKH